ncbi:3-hydroxyacyl-CoA dehydrogenase NAD-binding domain-containing protein [Brachybacterium sp. J144]|uniref:3-hydroxyacyl-CoA dehydrogenase NAD-binding domain-containing protein n=1 Tax=Brachybacterium sp. J144 TaxID=3116487 RepID=UPI002E78EB03|nr:3-hydroxyacyl-CoA dehydrogenase NAD-binding domain-containing protein [Brachybacterium sp. J144]MEE1650536.1 3-hydroxyacyl-CoA dehydrogenase NAD-binding domain-containing protein [Brachybacterium sp. J144]
MSSYTEHVTRVLREVRDHPGLGTVAVLTIAPPEGEESRPATLGPRSIEAVTGAISEALDRAEAGEIAAIALTGTGRTFLAGADLSMFADPTAAENVAAMTRAAHDLQIRVRRSPVPILAHLNGTALGGGLEVALMADVRTAAPGVRALGLPETGLGILPGWGGTTLLQSVVEPETAVRMILEDPARDLQLSAQAALEIGLVDAIAADLDEALEQFAALAAAHRDEETADGAGPAADVSEGAAAVGSASAAGSPWPGRSAPLPASGSPEAEALLDALDAPHSPVETRRARAARLEAQGAPAVGRALTLLQALPGSTLREALDREAEALAELVRSDAASASLYAAELLRRGKPGRTPVEGARELRRVGVAGAGLMASQIAAQLALGLQVPVVMRDLDEAIAEKGLAAARDVVAQTAAHGRIDAATAEAVAAGLSATTDLQELAGCDLVLEAVPEVLAIKRSVFAELEGVLAPDALLVTNTSSLSVAAMAEGLAHPERVVGLHFFNPVAKMPLVEVIHTEATDATTLATGLEVVRRLRKFAVRSADAPGFIVNRLLFRVLGGVLASLDAGADPAEVDASLDPLGLPMRPFALLDLVGLGVADHVGQVLREQLGDRFHASAGLSLMAQGGAHFTERSRTQVHPPVSPTVAEVFGQTSAESRSADEPLVGAALLERVRDGLAEEIGLMLEEGVAERPEQIDLALILGAGFPRHRGGITPYLDASGASRRAAGGSFHGERFARTAE